MLHQSLISPIIVLDVGHHDIGFPGSQSESSSPHLQIDIHVQLLGVVVSGSAMMSFVLLIPIPLIENGERAITLLETSILNRQLNQDTNYKKNTYHCFHVKPETKLI